MSIELAPKCRGQEEIIFRREMEMQGYTLGFSQEYQRKGDARAGFRNNNKPRGLQTCIFYIDDKQASEGGRRRKGDIGADDHKAEYHDE